MSVQIVLLPKNKSTHQLLELCNYLIYLTLIFALVTYSY